jgi:hypothetical protein
MLSCVSLPPLPGPPPRYPRRTVTLSGSALWLLFGFWQEALCLVCRRQALSNMASTPPAHLLGARAPGRQRAADCPAVGRPCRRPAHPQAGPGRACQLSCRDWQAPAFASPLSPPARPPASWPLPSLCRGCCPAAQPPARTVNPNVSHAAACPQHCEPQRQSRSRLPAAPQPNPASPRSGGPRRGRACTRARPAPGAGPSSLPFLAPPAWLPQRALACPRAPGATGPSCRPPRGRGRSPRAPALRRRPAARL